ncbi:MAG TPA: hypothetical protein VJH90_04400 [archaeon]|nr:hypothetical protein [archaeon]
MKIKELESEITLLKRRLEHLEKSNGHVSDEEARIMINRFISRKRLEGASRLNILDIMAELNLPPEQINKVMRFMEKRGIVKEVG